jgi:predicted AAA+ superfamily ATPase
VFDALAEWNPWWSGKKVDPELVGRERELSRRADELLAFKQVKTVIGMRRTGKSTLIYQFIDHLLRKGTDPSAVLLVNFEDPALAGATLASLFNEYQSRKNPDHKPFLFLDEVHRCREWAMFLRKLYDLKKVEQAFITDSSSRFLNAEYAGLLTGRQVNVMVSPLSFREHLGWNDRQADPQSRDDINRAKHLLESYLRWGGLPEVVLMKSLTRRKILLDNYLGDIVHKDIAERHGTDYQKIRGLVDYLVTNTGCLFSPRKYSRTFGLSLDALNSYTGYLREVFLFHPVPKFSHSIRSQQLSPKKMYLLDTGFFGGAGFRFSENTGRVYENAVCNHLLRSGRSIFYWAGKGECDFIARGDGPGDIAAIQVCIDPEKDAKEREVRGLVEAMEFFKLSRGTIVTADIEGKEKSGGKTIEYVPLWKYLLS